MIFHRTLNWVFKFYIISPNSHQVIGVEIKWTPCCSQLLQKHFLNENNSIRIPLKFVIYGSILSQHWSRWLVGAEQATGSYLNQWMMAYTVYLKKYAHGFVVLCFVVVMQSFIMNSHEVFIHIHQGCFAGTGAIVRLPQCQWSKPDGYGKISQCISTTKHSKAKTVCIFLGIYCSLSMYQRY